MKPIHFLVGFSAFLRFLIDWNAIWSMDFIVFDLWKYDHNRATEIAFEVRYFCCKKTEEKKNNMKPNGCQQVNIMNVRVF